MREYIFQPQNQFVYIEFTVRTSTRKKRCLGDDILASLEYCREYRRRHPYEEAHVYDETHPREGGRRLGSPVLIM